MAEVLALQLADTAATERCGAVLAQTLPAAGLLTLEGPLGAGKTTLVRGLLRALGHTGRVRSPSYSLLESYELPTARVVHHLDLYRIGSPDELDALGVRELFQPNALVLVEWPQRAGTVLPPALLHLELAYREPGREVQLRSDDVGLLERIRTATAHEQYRLTNGLHEENACQ